MRRFLSDVSALAVFLVSLLMAGCATTQTEFDPVQAAKYVKDKAPLISASCRAITTLAIQYAEKDPERRDLLNGQIKAVAANLNALVTAGTVDPDAVCEALKVKEQYISDILGGVAVLYRAEYENLQKNGWSSFAIEILKAVSAGLK